MTSKTKDAGADVKYAIPARGRKLSIDCDVRVLFIVLFLIGIGASLVASSSSFFAGVAFEDHFALMRRHVTRSAIALVVLVVASNIDYRVYRKMAPMFLVTGLLLLLGLFVYGQAIRDSARWYRISWLNATLQPSEFARVALVFFLAYWITRTGRDFQDLKRGFLPAAIAVATVVGVVAAAPNYGTATATVAIALIIMFLGGARIVHLAGFVAAGALVAAIRMVQEPYVRNRITAYFNRGDSLTEHNWQVFQSLVGFGSGGVFGAGLGNGQQQLNWLPDSYTDFIFSIVGEELGLLGTLAVSALFVLLVLRALKISRGCSDTFGEILVVGLGSSIFVYAVLNMFVATGLFPVTGLPLPFLSYGGSALVVNAFAMGVLLNVSKKRPGKSPARPTTRRSRIARPVRRQRYDTAEVV
jgi:cell division protein FtsW